MTNSDNYFILPSVKKNTLQVVLFMSGKNKNTKESVSETLKEVVELSILYDFYGELLGEHKKQIFEDYVLNDLSLGEIAEEAGISRQGVYDIIKRCTKKLKEYEEKLMLVQKFHITKAKVNQIKELSEEMLAFNEVNHLKQIVQITEDILHEL